MPRVVDLRGRAQDRPLALRFPPGHRLVVSGLPGGGKSTLMRRAAAGRGALLVDAQDVCESWARRLPVRLPYPLLRPAVRLAHYARLWRALRRGEGVAGVVVHDCGRNAWVRRWLAADGRRRGRAYHLLLLDVPPALALAGQAVRRRSVSAAAFRRHRRALSRLVTDLTAGRLPPGCASAVLLDQAAAAAVRELAFAAPAPGPRPV
ncbi:AAA family ATPase [Streptomyces hoynatensis]|uniref:ATP-binding protein n=1 Tax=Streptomyces hoynatensis TaxID=1141874 RepID=A0A3A9YYK1_9ACTN|nr:AAA family ATPase [Streptomyces hoynatensis]RKN41222.1 ATP-binding protein [Streptomyces hoynatensis]